MDITNQSKKKLVEIGTEANSNAVKIEIEVFTLDELQVNITEHSMVPKHRILRDDEREDLLNHYKIKPAQLPKIQK